MAIFISRNFAEILAEEGKKGFYSLKIKCGTPEITARSFQELIGRERKYLYEDYVLRAVLREIDELDFPFDFLLRAEFGTSVCLIKDLSETEIAYLMDTPHDVIMLDYHIVTQSVCQCFMEELAAYTAMSQLVGQAISTDKIITLK